MATKHLTTPTMARRMLPARSLRNGQQQRFQLQCLHEHSRERLQAYRNARSFSTTTAARVHNQTFLLPDNRQAKGTESPKLQQAQQLAKGQDVPSDLGLIQQTFIMPTGANRPSWSYDVRQRMTIEWYRWRSKFYNLYLSLYYKYFIRTKEQRKANGKIVLNYPFGSRKLAATAEQLHRDMYAAVAAGDAHTLKELCADGILAQLRARISRRAPAETLEWRCERVASPQVVSHRALLLPYKNPDGSAAAMRQAVVRLKTRQWLKRSTPRTRAASKTTFQRGIERQFGRKGPAPKPVASATEDKEMRVSEGEPREVTEYFVIQRRLWKGAEEPWMVWGMTEETTVQALEEMRDEMKSMKGAKQTQAAEKLKEVVTAKA